jgi:hypothetical protein
MRRFLYSSTDLSYDSGKIVQTIIQAGSDQSHSNIGDIYRGREASNIFYFDI